MIRGIRFKMPNEYNYFLNKILLDIDTQNYIWKIINQETMLESNCSKKLFIQSEYSDSSFRKAIIKEKSYLIFANIQMYPKNSKKIEFKNYLEFLNSSCELAILIIDSTFVDIYCKNDDFIKKLKSNAYSNNFENIEYITDDNDIIKQFIAR